MIDQIEGIVIMVSNQQKALEFYTQKLGFEKKLDTDTAGFRWIVVGPKNSDTVISLVDSPQMKKESSEEKQRAENRIGHSTGVWFFTKDIKKTFAELKENQVEVTEPQKQVWGGTMCTVYDQDHNSFGLVGD